MLLEAVLLAGALTQRMPTGVVSVAQLKEEQQATEKLPDIPEGYQTKFQAIVIRQQMARKDLEKTINKYRDLQQQIQDIDNEGFALEKKMFKEMGLSPDEYTTQVSTSGVLVVIHQPHKDK